MQARPRLGAGSMKAPRGSIGGFPDGSRSTVTAQHWLDHVGLVVHDLDAAAAAYARLGFQLTDKSRHWGTTGSAAAETRWGTANCCAMFERGYLEIAGIVDPSLYTNRLEEFLERFEGCHILAFGSHDPQATRTRLSQDGFSPAKIAHLSRPLDEAGGERVAFRLVRMAPADAPEGRLVFLRHETPELMWRPELKVHPNGAKALSALFLCADDVAEAAARYSYLLDAPASVSCKDRATITLGDQEIQILSPRLAVSRLPGLRDTPTPFAAGFAVEVEDLDVTAALLRSSMVRHTIRAGEMVVPPAEAAGAVCIFRSGPSDGA